MLYTFLVAAMNKKADMTVYSTCPLREDDLAFCSQMEQRFNYPRYVRIKGYLPVLIGKRILI